MKPEQFIREYGVDKAREVVEGAPNSANVYDIDNNEYADTREDTFGLSCNLIGLRSLGRLVVSLDIIDALEGIKGAKGTLYNLIQLEWDEFEHRYIDNWTCTKERLEHAIRDHELIYGGGDD
ncbi:hypothetical protein [Acinetobacter baumannii]|uniref:hypothetical protein n=1 Tax=Acinetobacter baumannii TaxID=470 RepID=UPI00102037C3|nr:hypothetical protein [Acinetobacter baumannii]RYL19989.1 hypothetical protein EWO92_03065 [Acinetobacter baumannii]RYL32309.1 hypothetical protein EWO96_00750 [Acinetobacter baumannii]RYL45429.1 hypothetical protein EWP49_00750 [Acinetobacter baumannii]